MKRSFKRDERSCFLQRLLLISIITSSLLTTIFLFSSPQINMMPQTDISFPDASGGDLSPRENVIDEVQFGGSENLPDGGYIEDPDYHVFWYLHICDTQSCWMQWGGDRREETSEQILNANYFFGTTRTVIDPVFTINTGDLVDSDYHSFFTRNEGQRADEWAYYNETLTANGVNSTNYFDIVGNHDVYRDPHFDYYLNYSISGSAFGTDQFLVNLDFGWGNYSFFMLSSTEDYGLEYPYALGGRLNSEELAWFEDNLKQETDSNVSFAFGHQPPFEVLSSLSPDKKTFLGLMDDYGVDAYLCGHGHMNAYQEIDGLAAVETNKFSEDSGCYRIVAVDDDGISMSYQIGKQWPVGIITHPVDVHYAIGDYDMDVHANPEKIRTLAWDPQGVISVEWRSSRDSTWKPMTQISGEALWEGDFDTNLVDGVEHTIEVKITGNSGEKIESIVYKSTEKSFFGWNEGIWIIVTFFIGIVVVVPIALYSMRKRGYKRIQKRKDETVDKTQAKYLLFKFLALLLAPIAIAPIYTESLTVVFSLFIVSKVGLIFTDVTFIFLAITAAPVLFQMFCLSPRKAKWMILHCLGSFLVMSIMVAFYILHFGLLGLVLPAYYIAVVFDVLIIKRSLQIKNP